MLKHEFTERTGISLTDEEYAKVDAMYLSAGDIDKDVFCSDYKKHSSSVLLNTYYEESTYFEQQNKTMRQQLDNMCMFLADQFYDTEINEFRKQAIEVWGEKKYLQYVLSKDYDLCKEDKQLLFLIVANLKED